MAQVSPDQQDDDNNNDNNDDSNDDDDDNVNVDNVEQKQNPKFRLFGRYQDWKGYFKSP